MPQTEYVLLPVYERRRGSEIAQVAVSARHGPALMSLDLTYWYVGDRRGKFPILRRSLRAIDQDGIHRQRNIFLHRVIALAIETDRDLPLDTQDLYNQLLNLRPYVMREVSTPLSRELGGFDLRDENIIRADAAQPWNHGSRVQITTPRAVMPQIGRSPTASELSEATLRDMAIASLAEEEFAQVRDDDTIEDIEAQRAAAAGDYGGRKLEMSIGDILGLASAGGDIAKVRQIKGESDDDLPKDFFGGEK